MVWPAGSKRSYSRKGCLKPLHHHFLDFGDGLGGVEALRAGVRTVHDRVAAVEAERVFERVQPFARGLVAAVSDPAVSLQQHGGAEEAVAVPPVGRARGRAAEAEDASCRAVAVRAVELVRIRLGLQAFAVGRRAVGFQPGFYGRILGVDMVQVGDEILDDGHVRQRRYFDIALAFGDRLGACEGVRAVYIHGAGTADPLPAGTAQGQGRVDLVLDIEKRVEHHRAAFVEIDGDVVHAGVFGLPLLVTIIGAPAVEAEGLAVFGAVCSVHALALADHRILGEGQFGHGRVALDVRFLPLNLDLLHAKVKPRQASSGKKGIFRENKVAKRL